MIFTIKIIIVWIAQFPRFMMYHTYDKCWYWFTKAKVLFCGWGIHLFTGKFGAGKTSLMTIKAYKLACEYPQLCILTNINLINFPKWTRIYKLETAQDILNAPKNCLVLIDEIGTIFNSRDFSSGKTAVPKPLYQHLCQCRKRRMMIYATVQRFNLLDKQIRDITADVTECSSSPAHPFTRILIGRRYDIEEYEAFSANRSYSPKMNGSCVFIQRNQFRQLYDTSQLVSGFLKKDYLSDVEILHNQGLSEFSVDSTERKFFGLVRKK